MYVGYDVPFCCVTISVFPHHLQAIFLPYHFQILSLLHFSCQCEICSMDGRKTRAWSSM